MDKLEQYWSGGSGSGFSASSTCNNNTAHTMAELVHNSCEDENDNGSGSGSGFGSGSGYNKDCHDDCPFHDYIAFAANITTPCNNSLCNDGSDNHDSIPIACCAVVETYCNSVQDPGCNSSEVLLVLANSCSETGSETGSPTSLQPTNAPIPSAVPTSGAPTVAPPAAYCHATGDPHYRSFDGKYYNFQGQCEYIFTSDCTGSHGFEVQVRNTWRRPLPSGQVTTTYAVGVRLPLTNNTSSRVLEMYRSPSMNQLDGNTMPTLPYVDLHGNSITRSGNSFTVIVESVGATIFWDSGATLRVTLAVGSPLLNTACGLCGDANSSMVGEDAVIMMNDHWIVNPNTTRLPLLPHDNTRPAICTESPVPETTDPCGTVAARTAAETYCGALNDANGNYGACFDNVDPVEIFEDCVFDHCVDPNVACGTLRLYEDECKSQGETNIVSVVDACGVCYGDGSSCQRTCTFFVFDYVLCWD